MKTSNISKKMLLIIASLILLLAFILPTVALATEDTVVITEIVEEREEEPVEEVTEEPVEEVTEEPVEEVTEEPAEIVVEETKLGKLEGLKKLLKIFQFKLEDRNLVLKVDGKEVNVDADAGATVGLVMENGELGVIVVNGQARFGKLQIVNNGQGSATVNLGAKKFSGEGSVNILDKFTIGGNGSISFDIDMANLELLVTADGTAKIGNFSIPANGTASIALNLSEDQLLNKIQIKLVEASIMGHDINVNIVNNIIELIKRIIGRLISLVLGGINLLGK